MIAETFRREGGYVNDADDSGGKTKYGITAETYGAYLGLDGDATEKQVKALTKKTAEKIYETLYYRHKNIHRLPLAIQYVVFDAGVLAGTGTAIHRLQVCINLYCDLMGLPKIETDGGIGKITIQRAKDVIGNGSGRELRDLFCIERREFLYDLANRRPKDRKYFYNMKKKTKAGWLIRSEYDMSEMYRLTDADITKLTEGW